MNVLQTLDSLNHGGAETLVLDVCRNAESFGIDMIFVATGGGDLEKDFENSGTPFLRLQRELPVDPGLVWRLRQIIKENDIDIVHCHQPVEALHVYLATIGLGVKRVLTHHGGGLFLKSARNRMTAKLLAPRMDANVSCSRGLFPWLRDEVGLDTTGNFFLLHNGVDPHRLESRAQSIKTEFGIDDDSLLLGMVANFMATNTKDQLTVCKALPDIFGKFENAYFIFVGAVTEGGEEYFDKCVKYCVDNGIGERVFFPGRRDDVPEILSSLDLFVFSTLHEGLPISLIEAMLAGLPVVATDIEPVLETTDNGKCVATFAPQDTAELAKKVIELLSNDQSRKKLAEDGKLHALAHFSISSHLRALKTLYTELLAD